MRLDDYAPELYVLVQGDEIITVTGDRRLAEKLAFVLEGSQILVCVVDHIETN